MPTRNYVLASQNIDSLFVRFHRRHEMEEKYEEIGHKLLEIFKDGFDESFFNQDELEYEYAILQLPLNLSLRFQEWGKKPFYIILFKGTKYLFEIDLSRIVRKGNKYTWFLNKPSHKINLEFLNDNLPWVVEIDEQYLNEVRNIKNELNSGTRLSKSGYQLCKNESWDSLSDKILDLISLIIAAHTGLTVSNQNDIFDIDDKDALEGYEFDLLIKARKRDRKIIGERKILDKYTCQACGFHLIVNDKPVIECHHINPIQFGKRKTNIQDLISLCPTCHRIAHLKRKPYTLDEIKKIINQKT